MAPPPLVNLVGKRPPTFVQPPWVYGPSEVNAWINAVYPSKGRPPPRRARRLAPSVRRLRIRLSESSTAKVRDAIVLGLASIGFRGASGSAHRVSARERGRRAVATIHHSFLWPGVVVSIFFDPRIRESASRHLLHLFADRFRVVKVSADE